MKVALINPPGLKPMRGLQMHTPNPPIGLAYLTAALEDAGHEVTIVDAVGEAPEAISRAPFQGDLMVQGLPVPEIVRRVPEDIHVVSVTCMFS